MPRSLLSVVTLLGLAMPLASCAQEGWYRCHYRATVEASDGREGVPCVAQAVKADEPNQGLLFIETRMKTGEPFHGWIGENEAYIYF